MLWLITSESPPWKAALPFYLRQRLSQRTPRISKKWALIPSCFQDATILSTVRTARSEVSKHEPAVVFALRYLSTNSFLGLVNSMSYGIVGSHRKSAKQLRWATGCFLSNALPRECGAYFAQGERDSPLVLRYRGTSTSRNPAHKNETNHPKRVYVARNRIIINAILSVPGQKNPCRGALAGPGIKT
jgi:hypothetical protein